MANPFGPTLQEATQAAELRNQKRLMEMAQLDIGGLATLSGAQAGQAIGQGIAGALGADIRPPEVIQAEQNQLMRSQFEGSVDRFMNQGMSEADALEKAADMQNLPFDIDQNIRKMARDIRAQKGELSLTEAKTEKAKIDAEQKAQLMGYVKDKDGILRNIETGKALFPGVEAEFSRTANNKKTQERQDKLFKRGFDIAKKYNADQTIEDFVAINDAFKDLISLAGQSGQAADTGITFRFMQIFEPSGVVREGEQAMVRYLDTPAAIRNLRMQGISAAELKELAEGQVMTLRPQTKVAILRAAGALHENKKKAADKVTDRFRQLATKGEIADLDTFVPYIGESIDIGRIEFPGGGRVLVRSGNEMAALPETPQRFSPDDTFFRLQQAINPPAQTLRRGRNRPR